MTDWKYEGHITLSSNMPERVVKYKPVEGCEECEFFETACAECIMYGEAEEVTDGQVETADN